MLFNSSTLNTGTYYGNGYESTSGGYSSNGVQRRATTSYLRNMTNVNAAGYSSQYAVISQYLADGETQKAYELMNQLEDEVRASLDSTNNNVYVSDADIKSQVENGFMATTGYSFDQAADLDGEFVHEFKKSLPFGGLFTNDCSREESLALRTGTEMTDRAKTKGTIGAALGGTVTGAGLTAGAFGVAAVLGASVSAPIVVPAVIIGAVGYGLFRGIKAAFSK